MGSALGAGALPLIAILVLDSTNFQISLLAVLSGVASAAVALPLGPWIEFRRKRPVMVGADLMRFVALGSVPAAATLGVLTYGQLCLVAVVQTACGIAFGAAGNAHLKNLVPAQRRVKANSRFETTQWIAHSAGSPVGGLLVSWLGPTSSVSLDAVSFLLSALGIRRLRSPEPPPPQRDAAQRRARDIADGWRYIFGHRGLRALFCNAMIFGGAIMAVSPLIAVLMLRDLGFSPWQYGLALGLPALGGIAGSVVAAPLVRRSSLRTVLLTTGLGRTLWMTVLPFAPPGYPGLLLIVAADTLLLFFAGVFNPAFATYRMNATGDGCMSRVVTAWSISSKSVQPVFIAAAGVLAAATSPRAAIMVMAIAVVASAAFLPWRAAGPDRAGVDADEPRRIPTPAAPRRISTRSSDHGGEER